MKKLLFSTTLLAALLLAACGDSNEEATPVKSTYIIDSQSIYSGNQEVVGKATYLCEGSPIKQYYEPDTMGYVSFCTTNDVDCFDGCYFFMIPVSGDMAFESEVTFWSPLDEYKQHAEYYGDTTYSKRIGIGDGYCVSAMPLNSISITADKDFDAEHPAGSLLNDLFVLQYASAYNLIKSGYDDDIDFLNRHPGSWDAYQLMPLSEFEPINLMHYEMALHFTKLPETLGEYTFTIAFDYGTDPVSGKEANKIAPAVVKAEFSEAAYVKVPVHEPLNKGE